MSNLEQMQHLAELVKQKNSVDGKIAEVIDRPTISGHFGEFVAAEIFGIELHGSAVQKDSDGHFVSGPFAGRTVQIKYYPKNESMLDMKIDGDEDFYLVLTGPRSAAVTSRGQVRPWVIEAAYLFDAASLKRRLTSKIGIATSIRTRVLGRSRSLPASQPRLSAHRISV